MEIFALIDKLEEVASEGRRLPMSRKLLVDAEKILGLVDQLRVAVPSNLAEAEEVLRKREELLNQSLGEARRIRTSAENEYRTKVEDHQLVKEAKAQADKIIAEAQQKAQRILDASDNDAATRRASSDQYSQEVLYKLEQEVSDILSTVRNGIELLEKRQSLVAK